MELLLVRKYLKAAYTIGCLWVGGTRFCDTLEDRVRDLSHEPKIPGETAIPSGCYEACLTLGKMCHDIGKHENVALFLEQAIKCDSI